MDLPATAPRRNRGFDETHREMIETAVRLISEKGAEALSIAALSRKMGINRTTVYYLFESREALLHAVANWATDQLAKAMDPTSTRPERLAYNSRFALENPELSKLWIDDFISGADIRDCFTRWDELVGSLQRDFDAAGTEIDAEVYCVTMLASSVIGPRVFRNSVRPEQSNEEIAARFFKELQRTLKRDGLIAE